MPQPFSHPSSMLFRVGQGAWILSSFSRRSFKARSEVTFAARGGMPTEMPHLEALGSLACLLYKDIQDITLALLIG